MASAVAGSGISAMLGASAMGHALVGALSYGVPSARMWTPGTAEPVLLVDVVVASLQGRESAGEYATKLGATRLAGLLVDLRGDEKDLAATFVQVVSLAGELPLAA
jgi:hypothetical protein